MCSLRLAFDGFGRECLTSESNRSGQSLSDLAQAAVRHYLSQTDSGRVAVRVPSFARLRLRAAELEVHVELSDDELAAVLVEAERQELPVERLLEHAALFYLADVDAGQATPPLASA